MEKTLGWSHKIGWSIWQMLMNAKSTQWIATRIDWYCLACLEKADTCPWIEMDAWAWLPLLSSPRRLFLCCARWWWRWLVVAAQRATSNPASLTKADLLHTAQPPTGGLSTISHQNMTMLFWFSYIQSNTLSSDIIWYLFIFLTFSFLHDLNFHFSFRQKEQKMALMFSS